VRTVIPTRADNSSTVRVASPETSDMAEIITTRT
jgi:hypothetical protein